MLRAVDVGVHDDADVGVGEAEAVAVWREALAAAAVEDIASPFRGLGGQVRAPVGAEEVQDASVTIVDAGDEGITLEELEEGLLVGGGEVDEARGGDTGRTPAASQGQSEGGGRIEMVAD